MAKIVSGIDRTQINVDTRVNVGLQFPLTFPSFKNQTTTKQVATNLRNLILTMKGERVMFPDFGSNIYNLLFEPISADNLSIACKDTIDEAVERYMPYVTIDSVTVEEEFDRNLVNIKVDYRVKGFEASEALDINVRV
tara:strand:+ start:585 stop:998 length:414 start_codon:yes stop_codon:yes gene_type:complete